MKSIWTGSIAFGLVNIPIKLFSAVESKSSVHFRLLHEKDNAPIKYKRVCSKEGKEVPWDEIVRGLEVSKGKYYVFTPEELEALKPEKSSRVEILEFVDEQSLDPIFFNSHYYVSPEEKGDRAFFLFRNVLQDSGRIGIGRFVMREKEYICSISSYKNGLILTTLNYEYEIREIGQIEELKNPPKLKKEETDLAKKLIEQLESDLDMSKYKDTFKDQIKALLKKKERGEPITFEVERAPATKSKDLISTLRASLK